MPNVGSIFPTHRISMLNPPNIKIKSTHYIHIYFMRNIKQTVHTSQRLVSECSKAKEELFIVGIDGTYKHLGRIFGYGFVFWSE